MQPGCGTASRLSSSRAPLGTHRPAAADACLHPGACSGSRLRSRDLRRRRPDRLDSYPADRGRRPPRGRGRGLAGGRTEARRPRATSNAKQLDALLVVDTFSCDGHRPELRVGRSRRMRFSDGGGSSRGLEQRRLEHRLALARLIRAFPDLLRPMTCDLVTVASLRRGGTSSRHRVGWMNGHGCESGKAGGGFRGARQVARQQVFRPPFAFPPTMGSGIGTADSSEIVYGCSGLRKASDRQATPRDPAEIHHCNASL